MSSAGSPKLTLALGAGMPRPFPSYSGAGTVCSSSLWMSFAICIGRDVRRIRLGSDLVR